MKKCKPLVAILMGSDSDYDVMKEAAEALREFGVPYEVTITSAHRSPKKTIQYVAAAEKNGVQVFICGAGHAAHLAGVVAAHTTLPVIGVPIDSSSLKGLDSLLSTVQMPPGVPVASMAIGKSGARNAGILSAQILSVGREDLRDKMRRFRKDMKEKVDEKDRQLKRKLEGK